MANPDNYQIGELEVVDIRKVWQHEAHNFTPWLLKNSDKLGKLLGIDLELVASEHPVGGFSLDLIGHDSSTGDLVIVENQLEQSDHSHLGQLLTYSGGTDAVNIIWIATSFREEHRAALDWLNNRTDEKTRFFAVSIAAVRIGDSDVAPLFTLVARPNNWNKIVKAASAAVSNNDKSGAYFEFWSQYLERLASEKPNWTNTNSVPTRSWISLRSGISAVTFGTNFSNQGLRSEVYFGSASTEVNEARFQAIYANKDEFEQRFGQPLSWETLEGKKASRIAFYWPNQKIDQLQDWEKFMDWFIDTQERLRSAAAPFIEQLKNVE